MPSLRSLTARLASLADRLARLGTDGALRNAAAQLEAERSAIAAAEARAAEIARRDGRRAA